MPPLLHRLTRRRVRYTDKPLKRREPRRLQHDWIYWSCVSGAIVVAFALYFWATSARLLKDPLHLDYGPTDPAFASALGPLVGAEFTGGNTVRTLVNGNQFFPAMLKAIREAKQTITMETYIWAPGHISEEFIFALNERARAGVKVHILVDGMGTLKFTRDDRARLEEAGVRFLKYGREHWYEVKPNINHRTHRKLLIVDGVIGFTGGMCIDDRWDGDAQSEEVWRDTVIEIRGPVVRQMQAVFAANWLRTTSTLLLGEGYYPAIERVGGSAAQCFMSGPTEGPQRARLGYYFAIAGARHSIDIAQAYFVPDALAIRMLIDARLRGVRVRIIVPDKSDSAFGRAASRSRWGALLDAGVEMYQFSGSMYHVKSMVVDDTLVTMGSANFDNRSFSINDEVTLNILDTHVAAEHERIFSDDLKRSKRLDPRVFASRPWYTKAADAFCGMFRSQF